MPLAETHASLDSLFMYAEAPGEPPLGSKPVKVQEWLRRINKDDTVDPMRLLGRLVEAYMEADCDAPYNVGAENLDRRTKLEKVFARCELRYLKGGSIASGLGTASITLEELIRVRNIASLDEEFARAIRNADSTPREAVSAACNLLESICKVYIGDEELEMPAKKDLQNVWAVVRKDLGIDASAVEDQDLKQIISGLLGVVGGIGSLRTHASSAHGQGRSGYRLEGRHARLAINSSHTVAAFILESWDRKKARRT